MPPADRIAEVVGVLPFPTGTGGDGLPGTVGKRKLQGQREAVFFTTRLHGEHIFTLPEKAGHIVPFRDRAAVPDRAEGEAVTYEGAEISDLRLAYAMSVHKSQGSEYAVVLMPLVLSHYILLQRNLFYTAITRAKKQVYLAGSKKALAAAVGNDRTRKRYSLLAERLKRYSE